MDYSAATAGISWRSVAWDVVAIVVLGLPMLYSLWINRSELKTDGAVFKFLVASVIGVAFTLGGLYGAIRGVYGSFECTRALSSASFASHIGSVRLVERFEKPGVGYSVYRVGDGEFKTNEAGLSCDCGYLVPLGRVRRLAEGEVVEIALLGDRALAVRSVRLGQ
jgi:hypothetical protein